MGALKERKVSEITSRRSIASSAPKHAIQAAFICGSPATLLRPLSTKVGTVWFPAAKLGPLVEAVIEKDFIHNQRQILLPA